MLSLFGLVLCWILRIFGILLLLVLLVLALVLLAPIHYEAEASYREKTSAARFRVYWLLHFLSVDGTYGTGRGLVYRVKILGVLVKGSQREKKTKSKNKDKRQKSGVDRKKKKAEDKKEENIKEGADLLQKKKEAGVPLQKSEVSPHREAGDASATEPEWKSQAEESRIIENKAKDILPGESCGARSDEITEERLGTQTEEIKLEKIKSEKVRSEEIRPNEIQLKEIQSKVTKSKEDKEDKSESKLEQTRSWADQTDASSEEVKSEGNRPESKKQESKKQESKSEETQSKGTQSKESKTGNQKEGTEEPSQGLAQKKEALQAKTQRVLDFLQNPENQEAFRLLVSQAKALFSHIRPRTFRLTGRFGCPDPAFTGQILGAVYMLYPIYGDSIQLSGDFEEAILEGNMELKGRIRLGTLMVIGIRVVMNKQVRKWIGR